MRRRMRKRADGLQVMTIHKAKGLEFDYVIVPGLDRVITTDDAQLMQWLERPTASGDPRGPGELLLSPIYRAGRRQESRFDLLLDRAITAAASDA